MEIQLTKNYETMSKLAAHILASQILLKPTSVLGLATGSTPTGTYRELVRMHKEEGLDFSSLYTVNLDEYKGLPADHPQSYRYFMQENLFDHVNVVPEHTFVPNGMEPDSEIACQEYERIIEDLGGVDIQLLGLGHDGHIAFNEPDDHFPSETHCAILDPRTREANQRFFASLDEVPTHAYTQGIGTIMRAKRLLMLVSGKDKHKILHEAIYGRVHPLVPASILQFHPNVLVIADEEAWHG